MTQDTNSGFRSREESKFLALLMRTQQKAAKITGAARRTFANSNRKNRKSSSNNYNKLLNAKRSSSNESRSASSGNERTENHFDNGSVRPKYINSSSAHTTDGECLDSSEEHLYDDKDAWKSIEESSKHYDWRLPKYVETLEIWLHDLEKHPHGPNKETLGEYQLKVDFLKKVVATLEEEKLEAETRIVNSANVDVDTNNYFKRKSSLPSHKGSPSGGFTRRSVPQEDMPNKTKSFSLMPHGQATTSDILSKEIHQKLEGRQSSRIRDELFDIDSEGSNGIDKNNAFSSSLRSQGDNGDLDELLHAHHSAQEKVAEEMLSLTKSLKEQTRVAGEIVRKDTVVMERSNQLAEANSDKLQMESDRLSEHTGSACRCWVWFLLGIVCITFVAMVMVMKIFRKRRHDEL